MKIRKYFLGGPNGVGKTTLCGMIKKVRPEFEIIKGSQVLMEFLGIAPGDYKALMKTPHKHALEQLGFLMDKIFEEYKDQSFIFDAHYLNLVRGKIKSVTGPWIARFDGILFLEASPETIMKRMRNDVSRDRALFPEDLNEEQSLKMLTEYIGSSADEFHRLVRNYRLPSIYLDGEQEGLRPALITFLSFDKIVIT